MVTKADLHRLIDALPDETAERAARLLAALAVPEDNEPTTADDLAAIAEAREDVARADLLALEDWRRTRHAG